MHSSSEIQLSNGLSVGISCIKLYRPHSLLQSLVAITVFKCNFGIFTSFDAKTWTKQIMANMWARNEGWWGFPTCRRDKIGGFHFKIGGLRPLPRSRSLLLRPRSCSRPGFLACGEWSTAPTLIMQVQYFHPQTWNKAIFNLGQKCVAVFDG